MSAALISACVLAVTMLSTAEPPLSVVGDGLISKPFSMSGPHGRGMRYAGPVVYSNEKPPIIFFPPPPKDAKPGFGGLSLFGKNKAPKSIKYVPMPHHDLPVLIYTSEKMPPIHVVQPPKSEGSVEYAPPRDEFSRPPAGSLSSAYRGIVPEATSGRIVTSSYEIPSTSYGTPMKAFGSALGSLDLSSAFPSSVEATAQQPEYSAGLGFEPVQLPPVSQPHYTNMQRPAGSIKKTPPHFLYSGNSPIHLFNEPDMFVQAPKEVPFKTYADMPPKASVGPSKPTYFGPASINSFATAHSHHHHHHRRPPLGSPYSIRPSFFPPRETLIPSESSQNPVNILPPKNNSPKVENNQAPAPSNEAGQSLGKPSTYSFSPPQTMFSFGPFSVEYGPPSEPFMSFSEPTGSLSSFYGAMNEVGGSASASASQSSSSSNTNSLKGIPGMEEEGWLPGPLPENIEGQAGEEAAWDAPMPPPLPSYERQRGLRPPSPYHGPRPNPMHSSVLLPSPGQATSLFSSSRLAHLLSAFKLKRGKPKYVVAPKSMHKPPIIIYYGKKPPIHVYQKPGEEYGSQTSASSVSSVTVTTSAESPSSDGKIISNDHNGGNSKETIQSVELTFDGSHKSEVRVAAPLPTPSGGDEKPAIIPAKPVDIFSSSDLQPSIYRARNSLNTIIVSDLSGDGASAIKTYIVRSNDNSPQQDQNSVFTISNENGNDNGNAGSIPIAQNRISGAAAGIGGGEAQSVPIVSEKEQVVQVENNGDNNGESSNDMSPTIVLAIGTPKQEAEEIQSQPSEPETTVIQSPSSFQTSLSQAEKESASAEESSS